MKDTCMDNSHLSWTYYISMGTVNGHIVYKANITAYFHGWLPLLFISITSDTVQRAHISGLLCQRQVSRAGTSKYIPHYLWNVMTYSCPCFWHTSPHILMSACSHAWLTFQHMSALRFRDTWGVDEIKLSSSTTKDFDFLPSFSQRFKMYII